jgi:transposase
VDRSTLEAFLQEGLSLEQISARVGRSASTVSYWLRKHGLQPAHKQKHAARDGIERMHLEALVESGASVRQIAAQLDRSTGSVRHWLLKYGLQTKRGAARRDRRTMANAGELTVQMDCDRHGRTAFRLENRGWYRCLQCRSDYVSRWRRRLKELLVEEAGGCCQQCGYDRYVGALHFHHLDPASKAFTLSGHGMTRSLERVREEARKCVLLCSNCHAEIEGGVTRYSDGE